MMKSRSLRLHAVLKPTARFTLMAVLIAALIAVGILPAATPVLAQSSTQSTAQSTLPTAKLSPCKFDVGLADALTQIDAQCTTVQVPENPADPNGRKIDLAVTVLAATGSGPKDLPVFHLEGGPGASAISNVGQTFFSAYRVLRDTHDIVLIDQRGTGKSSSLQCTEFTDQALKDLRAADDITEASATSLDRLKSCLTRLAKTTDPAFYTSTIMADDTDTVRAALGYDKINLYGDSYGTWLGQIYLARHGEHVNAMVLDSVAGPWNNYLLAAPATARAALDKTFALCESDLTCNTVYQNLPAQLDQALNLLEKEPQKVNAASSLTGKPYAVTMTRSRFLEIIRQLMYSSSSIGLIPQIVDQAAKGNFTIAATVAVSVAEQASMVSLGLYYSVHCSESQPFYTKDAISAADPNAFYGKAEAPNTLEDICKVWRSAELNSEDVAPVKSDRPVLIFSGAYDPITPAAFAEETHARLTNSTLVTFPYQAHGPFATSSCAGLLVKQFFAKPDAKLDISCAEKDSRPEFVGAYQVNLTNYKDPSGKFAVNVPDTYTVDKTKSAGGLTYFANEDQSQLMAVGSFSLKAREDATKLVVDALSKAYGGAIDIQATQVQGMVVAKLYIDQVGVMTKDGSTLGTLLILVQGDQARVVFLATPANVLQAATLSIAVPALTSLAGM